ncbi:MAG TPA: DUF1800 family protein, partial [Chloroflexota bacterium]|nr:DUF1800 family protein [Chloroflexota bacterium]
FFVADEPQVPAWSLVPPRDPAAIDQLVRTFESSGGEIRDVLRVLFNSDFFKAARFEKVKSPAELVVGVIKLVGTHKFPEASLLELDTATDTIGQQLMNPPTVEGWHTGREWINGGTLNERVNFAVNQLADLSKPGIQDIVNRLAARDGAPGGSLSSEQLVDYCLELVGPVEAGEETRRALLEASAADGPARFDGDEERQKSATRVGRLLQLIVASREYQFN